MNYALTDPNRESKVTFKASSIRSVLVYKSIIEAPDETVDFDSHIIFILENGRAIIFEVEIDLTDAVNMIITDSEKIDEAREVTDQDTRAAIYAEALDLVMELAVEMPLYQRNDLTVYNNTKIDGKTLNPAPTAFDGLFSKIWEVGYVN